MEKKLKNIIYLGPKEKYSLVKEELQKFNVVYVSSLDDLNANNVMKIIFSQAKKTNSTVIVSTHDKRIKKYFSNILEMKNE